MKIINGKIKEIILDEEEILLISTLRGNKRKIYISIKNGAFEIDDVPVEKLKQMKEEEKAIAIMKANIKGRIRK